MGAESFRPGPHRLTLTRGGCGCLDVDEHRHQAELVLVVHDLSRDAIATVISKIGSKSTIGELPASQTIPWAAPSVAADNSVSPINLAVVKVDDRQAVNVTEIHVESSKTMRYFARETNGESGPRESFFMPQTPQEFAKRVARSLTSPQFLDGKYVFSIVVWALPEGASHVDDVPRSSPARATYIQCGGSTEAMTIEIRVTHDDDSYEHYAVAHEPVTDPETWTTVSWDNGNPEPFTIQVHPEEVFTGEQAAPVFRAYIEEGALPPTELLRRINV